MKETMSRRPQISSVATVVVQRPTWVGWTWVPLVLLVAFVYSRTVAFGFWNDDYLLARPWSTREVLGTFHGPFDPSHSITAYFRPLGSLSFAIEWNVWGTALWGYHLTNIALHTAVTIGVWFVLHDLRVRWWAAVAGAAFFAIVPSNAATAVYIAERTDAMVAIAILVGLRCLWKYATTGQVSWIVALNAAYVLALMTKEVAVAMVPFAGAFWLYLSVEKTGPIATVGRPGFNSMRQFVSRELRIAWDALFDARARRDWVLILGSLLTCTLLYLIYRGAVMPAGAFVGRFNEGLSPMRALLAALHGTIKGIPWEISAKTELPVFVAFAIGFVVLPQSRVWRTVLLGVACMVAGVLPLCFNGGVEPRLFYVAEIGMAIAIAGLATLFGEALSVAREPAVRASLAVAFSVISLVTLAVFGLAHADAQNVFKPGSQPRLAKDLHVWLDPVSLQYVPQENMKVVESHLRQAGLIDANGRKTSAADLLLLDERH